MLRFWKEIGHLRKDAGAAGRGSEVRLLRRPADGQRHAASRPLPDPGDQRPLPALPHHARLSLRAQSRLGHARPAGRGRGLQRTGHPLEGGDRSLRRRAVHPQMPAKRLALHAGVGAAHRADRLLDPTSTRPMSPIIKATSKASGASLTESVQPRAALPGAQDRLVVGARGHGSVGRRSGAGLPRSGRPERVCAVSAG